MAFDDSVYARSIHENNPVDFGLTQVKVRQPSLDIGYFITKGNDYGYFEIHRKSGKIIIKGKLLLLCIEVVILRRPL